MKFKEKLAQKLDLPSEVMGSYKITIINNIIEIENFKGILEYKEGFIKLKIGEKIASLSGETLEILEMTDEAIQIKGIIKNIRF